MKICQGNTYLVKCGQYIGHFWHPGGRASW